MASQIHLLAEVGPDLLVDLKSRMQRGTEEKKKLQEELRASKDNVKNLSKRWMHSEQLVRMAQNREAQAKATMPGSFPMNNDNFSGGFPAQSERQTLLQAQSRRKFSSPATLHASSLLPANPGSTRRRLSNVSDAVTRKLSYSIGWKAAQVPAQDIITQGRCICGQYIKRRLRRSGLFNRKLGLQRIRSILGTTTMGVVRDVFPAVMMLGDELERMHPRVYTGVARQMCRTVGGEFHSADAVTLLRAVGRDLFRADITWSKVISLFAIAGGLSVDCVRQGHPEYLAKLMQGVSEVIEDELVPWINENGGWLGLNMHVLPATNSLNPLEWTTIVIGGVFGLVVLVIVIRFLIKIFERLKF